MRDTSTDVLVIGGGIAGSGLAALLAAGGVAVTVLERTTTFPDRVRGEMYTPWGVAIADQLGLLQPLLAAGATFSTEWVFYDSAVPTEIAEQNGLHASEVVAGVPGILNLTHPAACQALADHAVAAGATVGRGADSIEIELDGDRPVVRWRGADGEAHSAAANLVVGADGRASAVRKAAAIELHSAPVRQFITGLLVESRRPLASHIADHGTAAEVNWYSFPQNATTCRVYTAHHDVHRYTGSDGTARFFADLASCASPNVAAMSDGSAVTPLATHPSVDTWTDQPYARNVVLVGDAGGYNDPIVGQGLSLSMADVRDVSRVILAGGRTPGDFAGYGAARRDRHTKQRITAQTFAEMFCAFGADAASRRLRALPLLAADERVGLLGASLFAGPEILPPGAELLTLASEVLLSA